MLLIAWCHCPGRFAPNALLLRRFVAQDRGPFAPINADPRVVEFLPAPLTHKESDALADRIEAHFKKRGVGLWALEIVGIDSFAGFVGLSTPRFEAPFTPCVAETRRDVTGRTADTLSCRPPTRASSRGCWIR